MSEEPQVWRSLRGRKFETEKEAIADDREYAKQQIADEQRQEQQISDATTHTETQIGCLVLLTFITIFIPPLWPLTLGLVWWIIRRIR